MLMLPVLQQMYYCQLVVSVIMVYHDIFYKINMYVVFACIPGLYFSLLQQEHGSVSDMFPGDGHKF